MATFMFHVSKRQHSGSMARKWRIYLFSSWFRCSLIPKSHHHCFSSKDNYIIIFYLKSNVFVILLCLYPFNKYFLNAYKSIFQILAAIRRSWRACGTTSYWLHFSNLLILNALQVLRGWQSQPALSEPLLWRWWVLLGAQRIKIGYDTIFHYKLTYWVSTTITLIFVI